MKSLIAVIAILICPSILWAEHTEAEISRREISVAAEYESGVVRGTLYDVIFECEVDHNIESRASEQVFLSYSAVAADFDTSWRIAFMAKPAIWKSDIGWIRRNEPPSPDEYRFGGQYLSKRADARILIPPAYINGRHLKPLIELRHLRLRKDRHFELFCRGKSDLEKTDFGLGLAYSAGSLEAKIIYTNLDQIDWSIGFKTQLNTGF